MERVQAAVSSQHYLSSCMVQVAGAASLVAAESAAEAKQQLMVQRRRLPEQAQAFSDGFAVGLAFLLKVSLQTASAGCEGHVTHCASSGLS